MKKKDVILITVVVAIALVLAVFMYLGQGISGDRVRIMIEGKEYGSYSIFEERVIEVENDYGYNQIVINQGKVFMEKADCPDGYCVEHRAISKSNETIVCLPHKLVVELYGIAEEQDIDSVSQ